MDKFTTLTGTAAVMPLENINTDAIIPVTWIVNYGRDLGEGLFGVWRYHADGTERTEFVLNQAPYRDACILVGGRNFGCGSSREEAVWALLGFGIRCVIAPSFGDIFYENSFKNALLPIRMAQEDIDVLMRDPAFVAGAKLVVDLETCRVSVPGGSNGIAFDIDPARREALLQGFDHIDLTRQHVDEIAAFQAADKARRPWVHAPGKGE